MLKNLGNPFQYFQIKYTYSGIYKNEEVIKQKVLGSLGAIKMQCLQKNIPAIGLKISEANKLFHQLSMKGGRYGCKIIGDDVAAKILALHNRHENIFATDLEPYHENILDVAKYLNFIKYYKENLVLDMVNEIEKQIKENIEKEAAKIEEIRKQKVSDKNKVAR